MQLNCRVCSESFESSRKTTLYCGSTCRKRAQRMPKVQRRASKAAGSRSEALVATVERRLEDAGRLDTVAGQQALVLAQRMEQQGQTGSAVAQLSKELTVVMATALEGSSTVADPIDELRRRREEKRAV